MSKYIDVGLKTRFSLWEKRDKKYALGGKEEESCGVGLELGDQDKFMI